tara:strand:- start:5588 stop:6616 length:1029 start_codon:yes stop_codon:yes gene_type:complete
MAKKKGNKGAAGKSQRSARERKGSGRDDGESDIKAVRKNLEFLAGVEREKGAQASRLRQSNLDKLRVRQTRVEALRRERERAERDRQPDEKDDVNPDELLKSKMRRDIRAKDRDMFLRRELRDKEDAEDRQEEKAYFKGVDEREAAGKESVKSRMKRELREGQKNARQRQEEKSRLEALKRQDREAGITTSRPARPVVDLFGQATQSGKQPTVEVKPFEFHKTSLHRPSGHKSNRLHSTSDPVKAYARLEPEPQSKSKSKEIPQYVGDEQLFKSEGKPKPSPEPQPIKAAGFEFSRRAEAGRKKAQESKELSKAFSSLGGGRKVFSSRADEISYKLDQSARR